MGSCVVAFGSFAFFGIDGCRKCFGNVFRKLGCKMYCQVVLFLGVNDINAPLLGKQHAAISNLSAHFSVERGVG